MDTGKLEHCAKYSVYMSKHRECSNQQRRDISIYTRRSILIPPRGQKNRIIGSKMIGVDEKPRGPKYRYVLERETKLITLNLRDLHAGLVLVDIFHLTVSDRA